MPTGRNRARNGVFLARNRANLTRNGAFLLRNRANRVKAGGMFARNRADRVNNGAKVIGKGVDIFKTAVVGAWKVLRRANHFALVIQAFGATTDAVLYQSQRRRFLLA